MSQQRIRPYAPADRDAVLALAPRLAVGIAPWLDPDAVLTAARDWITAAIDGRGPGSAVFVATEVQGHPIGFVSVARRAHFTGEERAYIGELVVADGHEGRGVGCALLTATEEWAARQGLQAMELDTGAANTRARAFYRFLGYGEEGVKLVKLLRGAEH